MIEGIEILIWLEDGNTEDGNISFELSPTQAEVVFKALGININREKGTVSCFSDESLKKVILPKVNFKEI